MNPTTYCQFAPSSIASLLLLLLSCFSHVRLCATPVSTIFCLLHSTHKGTLSFSIPYLFNISAVSTYAVQRLSSSIVTDASTG